MLIFSDHVQPYTASPAATALSVGPIPFRNIYGSPNMAPPSFGGKINYSMTTTTNSKCLSCFFYY